MQIEKLNRLVDQERHRFEMLYDTDDEYKDKFDRAIEACLV